MGLLDSHKTSSHQTTVSKDLVARYQRLRALRLRLNSTLVRRLTRDAINEGGKRLGMLRRGTLVFDREDETSVLMDYCIYDVYHRGRNTIEEYLCDCPPDTDSEEMAFLRAMQHATYTLIVVLRVEPRVGCHVRNLFTEETRLLIDIGFSETARPGAMLATRLLDFGDFVITGGAALPVGMLSDDELDAWQRKICAGVDDPSFDPAAMIRACLKRGASSQIRYEAMNSQRRSDTRGDAPTVRSSAQQKRALAKLPAGKASANRRCRCGSGKMFKNCCGKR